MILTSLRLNNFRIHQASEIRFSENLNFIIGGNGQGKTTILEAIYYLCTTKNFKSSADGEFIRFGSDYYEINGEFLDNIKDKVRIYFSFEENKRYYFFNDKSVSRLSEMIGKFPVVLLTPDDHSITQGYPVDRRKFVDSIISQSNKIYLELLLDYNKTLRQRASLLNRLKDYRNSVLIDELDAWTNKLVNTGVDLIKYRVDFVSGFNTYLIDAYNKIMGDEESPAISYSFLNGENKNDIKDSFSSLINSKMEEEIRRGVNLVGPHRDDFIFSINGKNLKTFGSQGQHKTFQVGLRFAQFFYLKDKMGRVPIFLLDDVFGELDSVRSKNISDYLKQVGQAIITSTDFSNISYLQKSENDSTIFINNGEISYAA